MSDKTQIDALMRPEAYPHAVDDIRLHETHISWVLTTGQFAYKLKKPVRLPFLDFSEVDQRRHFCEEEVRLNRRTAPDLYLGVVPIAGTPSEPRLDQPGEIIDYAVKMRQFDDADRLDHVLDAGELDLAALARFGTRLAKFHADAGSDESAVRGPADVIAARLRRNLEELGALATADETAALAPLAAWTEQQLNTHYQLLDARAADGRIRECHGDMHLRNLVRLDGEIQAFDCIEFDPALRWIDVIDDLAFTVMDLELHAAAAAASVLLDAYLRESGDYAGLALLPLYTVYRALVRAKVAAIERDQNARDADATGRITALLALAARASVARTPRLVLMHGLPASGKSHVASTLVAALPAIRISSDVERKRLAGLGRHAGSGSAIGGGIYTEAHNRLTYERLAALAATIIAAGRHVIVDAAFLRRNDRETFVRLGRQCGVDTRLVCCTAPPEELDRRVLERARGPSDSEADRQVLDHARRTCEPMSGTETNIAIVVDTTARYSADDVTRAILAPGHAAGSG